MLRLLALLVAVLVVGSCEPPPPTATVNQTCNRHYNQIAAELDATNYCISHTDCMVADFGCPFGCMYALNKQADMKFFYDKMRLYRNECGKCEYACAPEKRRLQCIKHRCEIGFEEEVNPHKDEWRVYKNPSQRPR